MVRFTHFLAHLFSFQSFFSIFPYFCLHFCVPSFLLAHFCVSLTPPSTFSDLIGEIYKVNPLLFDFVMKRTLKSKKGNKFNVSSTCTIQLAWFVFGSAFDCADIYFQGTPRFKSIQNRLSGQPNR